ncbi:MAG: response regulator [Candidatus Gastranaerophilaceae bacterium]|jgi:PAS domain S-box-containing protein
MSLNLIKNKIVIVDDENLVTTTLTNLLRLETNYDVKTFNSPGIALEYIKNNPVDMIISDFLMPKMNGIELLSEVKKIKAGITLILLTGYADKENAIKAINEVGIYKYIEKPWDNDDLLITIKNGLERSHLVESLEEKVQELSIAQKELEEYSHKLEFLVQERTKELTDSNKKLRAVFDNCADGIITFSKDGTITRLNDSFVNFTSLKKEDITNLKFNELIATKSNEIFENIFESKSSNLIRDCFIFNRFNENYIPVEINIAPITDSDNLFVAVVRDITSQLKTERLRDDFIATLTHDLRTPLLAAIQTLKFFIDGTLGDIDEKQRKFLETMLCSNQDMLGLVNALLEVYKYESGKLNLCKDKFNIVELAEHCCNEIKPLANNKNITIELKSDKEILIYADRQEIRRVIANFLGNSIVHTEAGGKVLVEIKKNEEKISLSVPDTGSGIHENDIPQMFNRLSQGTSKKRSTGTGLGLYLSRQIIEAHSGKIGLKSKLGEGSKFYFLLDNSESFINTN